MGAGKPHPLKLTHHLNSLATETLLERVRHLASVEEIRDFIEEHEPESLPLLESVVDAGLTLPRHVVYEFALREAELAIETRRLVFADAARRDCVVFLPLPPHVVDLLRDDIAALECFNTEDRQPNHLRDIAQLPLQGGVLAKAYESLRNIASVAIDGQRSGSALSVRAGVAPLLSSLLERSVRRVYFHRIPHLPPGQEFVDVEVNPSRVDIRYI